VASQPPPQVERCRQHAAELGFGLSTTDAVGHLLATLAAGVPAGGRILELGTGAGVGLGWIVHGLGDRADVTVRSVESDAALAESARALGWPPAVAIVHGDALDELRRADAYDLIFADAQGGKTEGLELTLAALAPGGVLVMDDMDPVPEDPFHTELFPAIDAAGEAVLRHPDLVAARLDHGTGVVVAVRRLNPPPTART
jgi:predicted O-methyltransferase YrrM